MDGEDKQEQIDNAAQGSERGDSDMMGLMASSENLDDDDTLMQILIDGGGGMVVAGWLQTTLNWLRDFLEPLTIKLAPAAPYLQCSHFPFAAIPFENIFKGFREKRLTD